MADVELAEKPDSLLQTDCVICHLVLQNPCETTCCGVYFCRGCLEKYHSSKKSCPSCRAILTWHASKGHEKWIKQLKVVCKHKDRGCEWVGELGQLNKHLSDSRSSGCKFVFLECPRCHQDVARGDFSTHTSQHCQKNVKCPNYEKGCTLKIQRRAIPQHLNINPAAAQRHVGCGYVELDCIHGCGQAVLRKDLQQHESQCQLEVIGCEFRSIGCRVQMPRKDMPAHIAQLESHMLLLRQACIRSQQSSDESKSRVQNLQLSLNKECQQMLTKTKSQVNDLRLSMQNKNKSMESDIKKASLSMQKKIKYEMETLQRSVNEKTSSTKSLMVKKLTTMKGELHNEFGRLVEKKSLEFKNLCIFIIFLFICAVGYQQYRLTEISANNKVNTVQQNHYFQVFPTLLWPRENFTLTLDFLLNDTGPLYLRYSPSGPHDSFKAHITLRLSDHASFHIFKRHTLETEFGEWSSVTGFQVVLNSNVSCLVKGLRPFSIVHVRPYMQIYPPHMFAVCNWILNQRAIMPPTQFDSPFGLFHIGLHVNEFEGSLHVALHVDRELALEYDGKLKCITVALYRLSGDVLNFTFSILEYEDQYQFSVLPFSNFLDEFVGNNVCLTFTILFGSISPDIPHNVPVVLSRESSMQAPKLSLNAFNSSELPPANENATQVPEVSQDTLNSTETPQLDKNTIKLPEPLPKDVLTQPDIPPGVCKWFHPIMYCPPTTTKPKYTLKRTLSDLSNPDLQGISPYDKELDEQFSPLTRKELPKTLELQEHLNVMPDNRNKTRQLFPGNGNSSSTPKPKFPPLSNTCPLTSLGSSNSPSKNDSAKISVVSHDSAPLPTEGNHLDTGYSESAVSSLRDFNKHDKVDCRPLSRKSISDQSTSSKIELKPDSSLKSKLDSGPPKSNSSPPKLHSKSPSKRDSSPPKQSKQDFSPRKPGSSSPKQKSKHPSKQKSKRDSRRKTKEPSSSKYTHIAKNNFYAEMDIQALKYYTALRLRSLVPTFLMNILQHIANFINRYGQTFAFIYLFLCILAYAFDQN